MLASDAKTLDEDPDTGFQQYRYIRTSDDHFSLAFTYAWLAATDMSGARGWIALWRRQLEARKRAG